MPRILERHDCQRRLSHLTLLSANKAASVSWIRSRSLEASDSDSLRTEVFLSGRWTGMRNGAVMYYSRPWVVSISWLESEASSTGRQQLCHVVRHRHWNHVQNDYGYGSQDSETDSTKQCQRGYISTHHEETPNTASVISGLNNKHVISVFFFMTPMTF